MSPIDNLLLVYKDAASHQNDVGRLPVHILLANHGSTISSVSNLRSRIGIDSDSNLALRYNLSDLLSSLISAHPDSLESPDGVTGLYPFMLAASIPSIGVDIIYELLRMNPTLVAKGIPSLCYR